MITVDPDRCAYCGGCVSACPVGAINLAETRIVVSQACTECGVCLKACPVGALDENAAPLRAQFPYADAGWTESRLRDRYDLVVVGAGPAGSTAAWHAATFGLSVLLLEKRQEIGSPVRCAEGVPHTGLSQFLEPDPCWIAARIDKARITAMSEGKVVCDWQGEGGWGYVLERRLFDRALAERASRAGARVMVKAPVLGLMRAGAAVCGVVVEWQGTRAQIEAKIVIAADGIESRVGAWAGIDTHLPLKDTMVCAQYLLAGIDWHPGCLGFWIDEEIAPGGYAWVFPKGEGTANVGLGVQADLAGETALGYLNRFVEREPALSAGCPVTMVAGNVPVAQPLPHIFAGGLMIVGDAARQVDALTGGGIVNAMAAGRLAARVAANALAVRDVSQQRLSAYSEEVGQVLGRRLRRSHDLRLRFPPGQRANRRFVRLFAAVSGGK